MDVWNWRWLVRAYLVVFFFWHDVCHDDWWLTVCVITLNAAADIVHRSQPSVRANTRRRKEHGSARHVMLLLTMRCHGNPYVSQRTRTSASVHNSRTSYIFDWSSTISTYFAHIGDVYIRVCGTVNMFAIYVPETASVYQINKVRKKWRCAQQGNMCNALHIHEHNVFAQVIVKHK
jgi:hypothetical protein